MGTEYKNTFKRICEDLGIDMSDMNTDPLAFSKRCVGAGKALAIKLDEKKTTNDIEVQYKNDSNRNPEAIKVANALYEQISDLIFEQTPEVLACLLPMLPEITSSMNNEVKSEAMRKSGSRSLTKKHMHEMYMVLRDCHRAFANYHQLFDTAGFKHPELIPAKSGNYREESKIPLYRVIIDDEPYLSPWEAARVLGVKVSFYADIFEIVRTSGGKIKEFTVALEEF